MTAPAILSTVSTKTCPKCGCTRFSKHNRCLDCLSATQRIYRDKNPDVRKAGDIAYRAANAEKVLASKKAWHAKNRGRINEEKRLDRIASPEKHKERSKASYIRNKEAANLRTRSYYKNNTEKVKETIKEYRAINLKKINARMKVATQNRRAKKRENGGTLSKGIVGKLMALQKGKCPCCGLPLGDNYHMDHITPISAGGANIDSNIQLLRQRCNIQKHSKHPIDFMQSRGFLL